MYKWKVNTQAVSMQIIHIKLKRFCWEENFSWDKRKDNIYMAGQIYGKLNLSMYYYVNLCITVLKIMLWLCLCKQANICISVLLHASLRKSTPEIAVKFFVSTFFINFFMKTLLPDCTLGPLICLCMLQNVYIRLVCLRS